MPEAIDIRNNDFIIIDGNPFVVVERRHIAMQQRQASVALKVKNLRTGQVLDRSFKSAENIEEADISKVQVQFLYGNKGDYWFCEKGKPANRFSFKEDILGDVTKFLKANIEATALKFGDEIINIELPNKIDYKVTEAPPAIKGNTAQGGNKVVTIETGAKVNTPMFINEGDVIKVNTETGEYVERVEKN